MKVFADLHIHSKYARACSKELTPENLAVWAARKGITVLGTGDFTHPAWQTDLADALEEAELGLYRLKNSDNPTRFLYQAEIASIYKQGDKVRRVHNLIFASSQKAAQNITQALIDRGANLKSDGRPITGLHCEDLVKLVKDVDAASEVVPAHAWTPHFGVFGSLSGFNSLEEAYGNQAQHIWALETGLSSDPAMNYRVEALDALTLISNSDPHSLHRLGREANMIDVDLEKLSYSELIRVMRQRKPSEWLGTVEFFPEEGRYHLDGHADCKFSCEPQKTQALGGMCPVCGKQLLRGVLHRVDVLATRPHNQKHSTAPFTNLIPLEEIIADVLGVGVSSKKVQAAYLNATNVQTEFSILLDLSEIELAHIVGADVAAAIMQVRAGNVHIQAGYDGLYGHISIPKKQKQQGELF